MSRRGFTGYSVHLAITMVKKMNLIIQIIYIVDAVDNKKIPSQHFYTKILGIVKGNHNDTIFHLVRKYIYNVVCLTCDE